MAYVDVVVIACDAGPWVATGLFAAFGAASIRVLWPRAEGADGFTARPSSIIVDYLERTDGGAPSPSWVMYRDLALYAEEAHDANRDRHFIPLTRWFRAAVLLLTAEIVAWVADLALG